VAKKVCREVHNEILGYEFICNQNPQVFEEVCNPICAVTPIFGKRLKAILGYVRGRLVPYLPKVSLKFLGAKFLKSFRRKRKRI